MCGMTDKSQSYFPPGLLKTILVLVLGLASVTFYLQKNLKQIPAATAPTMMGMTGVVPSLPEKATVAPPVVHQITIKKKQTFGQLMQEQGFDASTIQAVFDSARDVYNLSKIGAGKNMTLTMTPELEFASLEYAIDPLQTLIVKKAEDEISAEMRTYTTQTNVHELGGTINGSLYNSIDKLGEEDELVIRFADIFEWDVDFFKDLQAGDTFRIVYEKQTVNGESYGYGKVLGAELVNKGHAYTAIGYQRGANWEFFSPDGKAMKKAFLAAPLKFTRISSGFTSARYHPVLKRFRAHYGIDYAAPTGTPVRAIGKGRVVSAGWAGGAGKMIKLQHDKEITTAYCHLSRFASGIRAGASVSQGQVIGYVGITGLATGPHLDFRFMKNGKYVNFLSIHSPQAEPLSKAEIAKFQAATSLMATRLEAVKLNEPPPDIAAVVTAGSAFTR